MNFRLLLLLLLGVFLFNRCVLSKKLGPQSETEQEPHPDHPEAMMQWEYDRVKDPKTGAVPRENLLAVYQDYLNRQAQESEAPISGIQWEERGPTNIGGRTRAIIFDKNDPTSKTVIAASVSGGLFKCTDIDATIPTWTKVNDFFSNLNICCLVQNQIHPDTLFFGTGEGFGGGDALRGMGVWRSTNGGATWSQLASLMNGTVPAYVNRLAIGKNGMIYAATSNGLFRSTNGNTWIAVVTTYTSPIAANNSGKDVKIGTNGDIYYANDGQVWRQFNTSSTWTNIKPTGVFVRIEIALAPSDTNYVYLMCSNGGSVNGFYTSTNRGATWTSNAVPYIYDGNSTPTVELSRGQSWYDMSLVVDPDTATTIYAGGVEYIKSKDAGATYKQITIWSPGAAPGYSGSQLLHADHHTLVFRPGNGSFGLFGCDGGVYRSTNLRNTYPVFPTYKAINSGYNVTQYYSCALANTVASNYFLAGAQDNGTSKFGTPGLGGAYVVVGGDGGFCFIDQDNSNNQIASYVQSNYYRSRDGGGLFSFLGTDNAGGFINPCDLDNTNNILYGYGGYDKITRWKTIFSTSYSKLSFTVTGVGSITHIKVSPNDPTTIYIGNTFGDVFRLKRADTITVTTTPVKLTINTGPFGGSISCIEIKKTVANTDDTMLVTMSNYNLGNSVYRTVSGSSNTPNWTDIDDNSTLPNIPVNWCIFSPANNGREVLLATEMGIYTCDNIFATTPVWGQSNTGLANVRVSMLKIRSADSLMAAATYGRGLFTSMKYSTPKAFFKADLLVNYMSSPIQFTDQSIQATSWAWDFDNNGTIDATTQNPVWAYGTPGYKTVKLVINGMYTKTLTNYIFIMPNKGLPYLLSDGGDFESNIDDFHGYTKSGTGWDYGDSAFYEKSGDVSLSHAWVTGINLYYYVNNSEAYLYTPNFNFSSTAIDTLEFDIMNVFELSYDGMRVEYSTDLGLNWQPLGTTVQADWYDFANTAANTSFPQNQAYFNAFNYPESHKKISVSFLSGNKNVAFRIAFRSDPAETRQGIQIDNFQIRSSATTVAKYSVETTLASKTEMFGPNATVDYYSPNGKIIATLINGSNFNYGLTTVTIDNNGTGGRNYDTNTVAVKKMISKTFRIDPTNNNTSGSYTIKLYFDSTEIAGWKSVTGNYFSNANILKCPVSIANGTALNGVYGTNRSFAKYGDVDSIIISSFNTGFSGFGVTKNLIALPVTWLKFEVTKFNQDAILRWSTATEKNNAGFYVERSYDLSNWTQVSFIAGAGNSYNIRSYNFTDPKILEFQSLVYYRIRQEDLNGKFSYSETRWVNNDKQAIAIQVTPQPAKDYIKITSAISDGFHYRIVDMKGIILIEGDLFEKNASIDIQKLSSGSYLLMLSKEEKLIYSNKFLKID